MFANLRTLFWIVSAYKDNNILYLVINSYINFQFKFIFQRYRKMELKYGHWICSLMSGGVSSSISAAEPQPRNYFQSGSFFHPFVKPMAATSTEGYFSNRCLMSCVKVFCTSMALSR